MSSLLCEQKLYAQGGRSFWVHNTGTFGCLPYVLDRFLITAAEVDRFGCAMPFNEVAQFFNHRLKKAMDGLGEVLPEASITYVDVYSVKRKLITQAKKFGIELKVFNFLSLLQNLQNSKLIGPPDVFRIP